MRALFSKLVLTIQSARAVSHQVCLTFVATCLLLPTCAAISHAGPGAISELTAPSEQDQTTQQNATAQNSGKLIKSIGFQGQWKLGHACTVKLQIPPKLVGQVSSAQITTLDGDGVEVRYQRDIVDVSSASIDVAVRIGRRQSVISASLVDSQGSILAFQDYTLEESEGLSATQPLILCIGSTMGLEDLVRVSKDESQKSLTLIQIEKADDLPNSWLTYQPCNLVIIESSKMQLLREIDASRWSALDDWIRRGGCCIVSLGAKADELRTINGLQSLLPGPIQGDVVINKPTTLETMISEQQLQPFPAIELKVPPTQVELSLKDSLAQQIPWWVRSGHGFGIVQTIASDLNHPSLAKWKQRKALWERLISPHIDKALLESSQSETASSTTYLGYGDLIGQLRATLDQFAQVRSVGFSQISAILVAILILIGPVDYFISVKLLRRPDLSWPIAGIILLGSAAALTVYCQTLRPNTVITNSAQIIDIDTQTGQMNGHLWSHVYSAHARTVNVYPQDFQGRILGYVDWQGLPGNGLGGLESQLTMERGMPVYEVVDSEGSSKILGIGIPAAGTKSFYATYSSKIEIQGQSSLKELDSVDQLEGHVTNPLNFELRDVSLFYHRWHYPLQSRMAPGDKVDISSQILPKDLVRRLNRQNEREGKATSIRWNPADRTNIDRLLELLMFHNAATGRNYTSLTHNYQPIIDHSNILQVDYAILTGRMETSPVQLRVDSDSSSDQPDMLSGIERTWCRILIPVEKRPKIKQAR